MTVEQYILEMNKDLIEKLKLLQEGELTHKQIADKFNTQQPNITRLVKRHAALFNKEK